MDSITELLQNGATVMILVIVGVILALIILLSRFYNRAFRGQALIRTGPGAVKVSFKGIFAFPIIHRLEKMDIFFPTMFSDGFLHLVRFLSQHL